MRTRACAAICCTLVPFAAAWPRVLGIAAVISLAALGADLPCGLRSAGISYQD